MGKNYSPRGGQSHPHSPSPPLPRRASAERTALGRDPGGGGLDQLGLRFRRHQQAPQHKRQDALPAGQPAAHHHAGCVAMAAITPPHPPPPLNYRLQVCLQLHQGLVPLEALKPRTSETEGASGRPGPVGPRVPVVPIPPLRFLSFVCIIHLMFSLD